jgi:hypothetical protein
MGYVEVPAGSGWKLFTYLRIELLEFFLFLQKVRSVSTNRDNRLLQ